MHHARQKPGPLHVPRALAASPHAPLYTVFGPLSRVVPSVPKLCKHLEQLAVQAVSAHRPVATEVLHLNIHVTVANVLSAMIFGGRHLLSLVAIFHARYTAAPVSVELNPTRKEEHGIMELLDLTGDDLEEVLAAADQRTKSRLRAKRLYYKKRVRRAPSTAAGASTHGHAAAQPARTAQLAVLLGPAHTPAGTARPSTRTYHQSQPSARRGTVHAMASQRTLQQERRARSSRTPHVTCHTPATPRHAQAASHG
ncbi:hypothetical protein ON010_g16055 [Phytophthora cinnamomi]|nr:hypothetical protein ON010_g16055 [Phytophthora cinnamomi]